MSDELYNKIKKAADNVELPIYQESAWSSFEQYAKEKDRPKILPWYTWGIGTLLLLLIFSNVFWWNKSRAIEKISAAETYEESLLELNKAPHHNSTIMVDSIKEIQYQASIANQQESIDQLIQNVNQLNAQIAVLTASKSKGLTYSNIQYSKVDKQKYISSNTGSAKNDISVAGEIGSFDSQYLNIINNAHSDQSEISQGAEDNSESPSLLTQLPYLSNAGLLPLAFSTQLPSGYMLNIESYKIKKNPLSFIIPKSLSLILQGGYSVTVDEELGYASGLNIGIGLSTAFSPHVRFITDIQLMSTSAEVDIEDIEDIGFLSDVVLPNNAKAKELYYDFSSVGIITGLDYMFTPKGRVRPYIGISYSFQFSQYQNQFLEYNLSNQSLVQILPERAFPMTQYIGLRGGLDFNFFQNLDASLNLSIQKSIYNESLVLFNISPGVQYHF